MTDNHDARRHVGTSARIDRRGFLQLGIAGGFASVVAACGWDGGSGVRPLLLDVSRVNDWVGEKILFSKNRLAPDYPIAQRTAQLPSYFISPTMPMLQDPKSWRLQVGGLVRTPLTLSLDDLQAMPGTTYTVKHHCVEGWSAIATWHGVPVSAVAARCGMLPQARYVRLGLGERDASADDSCLRHERQCVAPVARRAVAPVLAHEAGLQDDEVPRVGDVHGRAARRVLGGSGVSVVWRRVIEPFSRCAPGRRASPTRWGSGLPASWPSPAR